MPETEYETRKDSVLAWKKAQKLGRFDPDAPTLEEQKVRALEREVDERGPLSLRISLHPVTLHPSYIHAISAAQQPPGEP